MILLLWFVVFLIVLYGVARREKDVRVCRGGFLSGGNVWKLMVVNGEVMFEEGRVIKCWRVEWVVENMVFWMRGGKEVV